MEEKIDQLKNKKNNIRINDQGNNQSFGLFNDSKLNLVNLNSSNSFIRPLNDSHSLKFNEKNNLGILDREEFKQEFFDKFQSNSVTKQEIIVNP